MKTIKQTYHIKALPAVVWKALLDPSEIENWGGGPAVMTEHEGADFSLWGGDIHGTNLEVLHEEKLVQDWFGGDWDEPSRVTFTLTPEERGTTIELLHENIPDSEVADITEGWDLYYLGAMKKYLEEQA